MADTRLSRTVLITDLDNTLFDWVEIWYRCFSSMLRELARISGADLDELKREIREVHQRHGTSEYSFLIEEVALLRRHCSDTDLMVLYGEAIDAYREARRRHLSLYPTVAESLLKVKGAGALIVGYTESMAFYSNYRVRRLGLDGVFDTIFSPEDHDIPANIDLETMRKFPASHYSFKYTKHQHTPKGELKPNPQVLLDIIELISATPENCVYVGDSLFKDIAMALDAGVLDVWAKYGQAQHREEYELLREVTHWT
jgi:phosphoglycolate phosphatase-like HAD superfamily hydrolase